MPISVIIAQRLLALFYKYRYSNINRFAHNKRKVFFFQCLEWLGLVWDSRLYLFGIKTSLEIHLINIQDVYENDAKLDKLQWRHLFHLYLTKCSKNQNTTPNNMFIIWVVSVGDHSAILYTLKFCKQTYHCP